VGSSPGRSNQRLGNWYLHTVLRNKSKDWLACNQVNGYITCSHHDIAEIAQLALNSNHSKAA